MMIRNFFNSVKVAIKNLWRNRLMSIASITSVMATLIILGLVFILIININSFVEGAQDQFEEITVYLNDGLSAAQRTALMSDIKGISGVEDTLYLSKEQAMADWRIEWGENGYLLDGLDANPLPDSIIVTLTNLHNADEVAEIIRSFEHVESVPFSEDVINKIMGASQFIRTIGFVVILLLLVISTFIIGNTIKLAVNSRRREINIMKYVGATNWFIRRPFLIEGTILGLFGALVSAGLIYLVYNFIFDYFSSYFFVLFASYLVPANSIVNDLLLIFIVLGVGIGALGSINAMRRHLNV